MEKFKFVTQPENAIQAIFRFLSTLIVRVISRTGITPNQISIFRMLVVIFALVFFCRGDSESLFFGVVLFYVFEVLDHVDGDLARHKNLRSNLGPLLEQFIDTWSSRPSNLFGFCIAYGMYQDTASIFGFILFGLTALGRLLWLEYRSYFGWAPNNELLLHTYSAIWDKESSKRSLRNLFALLYVWNNTFLLLGALFYSPSLWNMGWSTLEIAFFIVAVLNNLPWVWITVQGFKKAMYEDRNS